MPTMTTTITRFNYRTWEWNIDRGLDHLAGGFSRSKSAAVSDAAIARRDIEVREAREAGRIVIGDTVTIRPEWRDPGDENYTWIAIETQAAGATHIRVCPVSRDGSHFGHMSLDLAHIASFRAPSTTP